VTQAEIKAEEARKKPHVMHLMDVNLKPIFRRPRYTSISIIRTRITMKKGLEFETMSLGTPLSFITAAWEVSLLVICPYASLRMWLGWRFETDG
jgi:hypothetical protein